MMSSAHTFIFLVLTNRIFPSVCLDFLSNYTQDSSLQIQLPDGLIQGKLQHTVSIGMPYYSYEGIPYAKPPVGQLRFKPPQVPDKWSGVLDANGKVPSCIQVPPSSWDWYESEDCLYINVYTPKAPSEKSSERLAVMVWIYGGGFLFGVANSTYYGPDYLLAENVVVVHFNYRVNVFGFLSTEDLVSPGNYGLKDQLLALKWVKNNIEFFSGDPNQITIFGESAGGVSVQYHLLSPKSTGLFQRAISESGSTLCPWALQTNPLQIAYLLGKATGLTAKSTTELIQHLLNLSSQKLRRAAFSITLLNSVNVAKGLPFSPTIEPEHEEAFISQKSFEKLKNGEFYKVPYIIGFNSQESAAAQIVLEIGEPILRMLPKNEVLIPPGLVVNERNIQTVWENINEFYFTNGKSTVQQYLDFISDSYFYRPIIESARLYSTHAPVFMYIFSYEGYLLGKRAFSLGQQNSVKGVMHAEEVWYIFARSDLIRASDMDKLTRRRMIKLWTNFAKNETPTPNQDALLENVEWPRFKIDSDYLYLDIASNLVVRRNYKRKMLEFWEELFENYGQPPFDTY